MSARDRNPLRAALLLVIATLSSACGSNTSACTLEARASVRIQVVDGQGHPQRDARVTFTRDGGPEQQALCNGSQTRQGNCDAWVTGYESPGEYVLTATSADGQRTVTQSVSVGEDACHVQTRSVTLVLPD
ncbi:hypothetical protein [Melittangium boletus]|uniref:Lipoprotein n=1 Tax=Melittangium boletus DSM 14713 TaxID=1294270 RepID=A0A250IF53_9BACT|nr:hypothetical protein [Melittangium boletus]ATB29777.1 hypothetical protein MEBOL_003232 [Melittangium boletus DSM 14713]